MKKLSISEIEQRINSIYSSAKLYKKTADSIRALLDKEVFNELNSRYNKNNGGGLGRLKYSSWLRGFATGYHFSVSNRIMQEEVEFCYEYEGKLYSTRDKDSIHPYWGDELSGALVATLKGNFYWKGTNKPYTTHEGK